MNIDVFISHHTKTSLHITEAICNSLESLGTKCWYAPRDTEKAYASSIVNAIKQCRVFVLVLNKESSYSEDVLNEINLAVERMRRGDDISIIPFHISNEEISDDAKYYLGRIHWIDAIDPPMMERIKELTNKVQSYLGKENSKPVNNTRAITLQSNIVLPSKNFIGRDKELDNIKEELDNYGKVFIKGIGGIGKSEIAKMFCKKYRGDFNTIVFANYKTDIKDMIISEKEIPIKNLERITDSEGKIENDITFFKRKLQILKKITDDKTLIIVDNFDIEEDKYLEEFLDGNYRIIFTTRNDFEHLGYPVIEINSLTEENNLELFYTNCKLRITNIDKLKEIIRLVKGHTLAIILIAKFMQNNRMQAEDMYNLLKSNGIKEIEGNIKYSFNKGSMYDYIKTLFNMSKLNTEETYIVMNLSILPNDGIELTKFAKLCEIDNYSIIDNLINKSWILHDWYTDNISLHPLISEVVEKECKPNLDKCNILFKNIAKRIKEGWKGNKEEELKYGEICKKILNKYPNVELKNLEEYRTIKTQLAELGYLDIIDKINNDILELSIKEYGSISKETARAYFEIAEDYLRKCDYKESEIYYKKAVDIIRKVDNEILYRAYLIKAYCLLLLKMEKAKVAKPLLEECLKIYEENKDKELRQLGSTYFALGKVYYQLQDYDKALELSKKALDLLTKTSGERSYDVSSPMQVIGLTYSKLGRYEEALELINKVIDLRNSFYNDESHINILVTYESLATIYDEMKDYNKEKETLTKLKDLLKNKVDENNDWYKRIINKIELCEEKIK